MAQVFGIMHGFRVSGGSAHHDFLGQRHAIFNRLTRASHESRLVSMPRLWCRAFPLRSPDFLRLAPENCCLLSACLTQSGAARRRSRLPQPGGRFRSAATLAAAIQVRGIIREDNDQRTAPSMRHSPIKMSKRAHWPFGGRPATTGGRRQPCGLAERPPRLSARGFRSASDLREQRRAWSSTPTRATVRPRAAARSSH